MIEKNKFFILYNIVIVYKFSIYLFVFLNERNDVIGQMTRDP